jgi:hypothetical protein
VQLLDSEVPALIDAMVDSLNIANLPTVLFARLGKRLELLTNTQAIDANLRVIIIQVVRAAQEGGWVRDLVEAIYAERPQNQLVVAFRTTYRARLRLLPADLYTSHEVRKGFLFANRAELRDKLRVFFQGSAARVLAVNGPDGSGRAYSYQFIEHLSLNGPWYRVAHLNLTHYGGREPIALLRAIFARLGVPLPPIAERDSRDVLELCTVLETELNSRNEPLCVVFSRFADANLTTTTHEFILKLAVLAEHKIQLLRVVLLGYESDDRQLPVEIHDDVLREKILPPTPEDFAQCAVGILAAHGFTGLTAADLLPDIRKIFDRHSATLPTGIRTPDRLKRIEREVRQYVDRALVQAEQLATRSPTAGSLSAGNSAVERPHQEAAPAPGGGS